MARFILHIEVLPVEYQMEWEVPDEVLAIDPELVKKAERLMVTRQRIGSAEHRVISYTMDNEPIDVV